VQYLVEDRLQSALSKPVQTPSHATVLLVVEALDMQACATPRLTSVEVLISFAHAVQMRSQLVTIVVATTAMDVAKVSMSIRVKVTITVNAVQAQGQSQHIVNCDQS
jgi:hypothetical protein